MTRSRPATTRRGTATRPTRSKTPGSTKCSTGFACWARWKSLAASLTAVPSSKAGLLFRRWCLPITIQGWPAMLSEERNRIVTETGAGTPMGELMRRYWQPIAAVSELEEKPIKRVRLMGEDLTLFKDLSGHYGLVDRH